MKHYGVQERWLQCKRGARERRNENVFHMLLKTFYSVFCKPPHRIYLCGSRLHSRPLVRTIIQISACTGPRWFSKFSSLIAYCLLFIVFYINNLGNWNTFITSEHLPGRFDNCGALRNLRGGSTRLKIAWVQQRQYHRAHGSARERVLSLALINSFVMIPRPTSLLMMKRRSQRAR